MPGAPARWSALPQRLNAARTRRTSPFPRQSSPSPRRSSRSPPPATATPRSPQTRGRPAPRTPSPQGAAAASASAPPAPAVPPPRAAPAPPSLPPPAAVAIRHHRPGQEIVRQLDALGAVALLHPQEPAVDQPAELLLGEKRRNRVVFRVAVAEAFLRDQVGFDEPAHGVGQPFHTRTVVVRDDPLLRAFQELGVEPLRPLLLAPLVQ